VLFALVFFAVDFFAVFFEVFLGDASVAALSSDAAAGPSPLPVVVLRGRRVVCFAAGRSGSSARTSSLRPTTIEM
jgi:hypothetical protein